MDELFAEFRRALRRCTAQPGASAVAILTLGLGIGLCTLLIAVAHGTLLRDLPFAGGDRIVVMGRADAASAGGGYRIPRSQIEALRESQSTFETLGGFFTLYSHLTAQGPEGASTETYITSFSTADLFEVTRVVPILGRTLVPEDDTPGAPSVVVLDAGVWRQQFGGDPDVLGRSVVVNRVQATVVGVVPGGLGFPLQHRVWLNMGGVQHEDPWLFGFGKLKEGVSIPQSLADLEALARGWDDTTADDRAEAPTGPTVAVEPYITALTDQRFVMGLRLLAVAVLAVLLIVSANIASLMLARLFGRRRELWVRAALGASRGRLIVPIFVETLMLSLAGGVVGLGVAKAGIHVFSQSLQESFLRAFWIDIQLDDRALAGAFGISVLTALAASLLPAWRAASLRKARVAWNARSERPGRWSDALVVTEVALSCALLIVAGLLATSLLELSAVEHGFEPDGLMTATVSLWQLGELDEGRQEQTKNFFADLHRRLAAHPGVESVALTSSLPLGRSPSGQYPVEHVTYGEDETPTARTIAVSPEFFEVLRTPLLEGRAFDSRDIPESEPTVIVNRRFAERWLGDGNSVGRRLRLGNGGEWATVIGVVENISMGVYTHSHDAAVYWPLSGQSPQILSAVARVPTDPESMVPIIRTAVRDLDPQATSYRFEALATTVARQSWIQRILGTLVGLFAATAVLIAGLGLYGVLGQYVGLRRREIGIRLALGAKPSAIVQRVLGHGMRRVSLGLGLGTLIAIGGTRLLDSLLYGVSPWDPGIFAITCAALGLVGTLACWAPAQRTAAIHPAETLKVE